MRLLAALLVATLSSPSTDATGVICSSNSDCTRGETCVAGDSPHPIQACVAGAVCGGLTAGNCPSDSSSGQLACIAHDGIHKCVSAYRCDQYFGEATCSGGCNDGNGVLCNDQGFCSLISMGSDGRPTYGCTCKDGFSGDKCESSSTTSSDSLATSSFKDTDDSDDPMMSSRGSNDSTSTLPLPEATPEANRNIVPEFTDNRPMSSQSDARGTSSAVFITIGVLASCIFIGALLFAIYSRQKQREGAQADGFGRTAAFITPVASVESDREGGIGNDTPKSSIITM